MLIIMSFLNTLSMVHVGHKALNSPSNTMSPFCTYQYIKKPQPPPLSPNKSEVYSSSSLTSLLLHIQCDLNPFINKLHNLFKVCLLELSGCQSRSSCKRDRQIKGRWELKEVHEVNKKGEDWCWQTDWQDDGQKYTDGQKQTETHHTDRHTERNERFQILIGRKTDWLADSPQTASTHASLHQEQSVDEHRLNKL